MCEDILAGFVYQMNKIACATKNKTTAGTRTYVLALRDTPSNTSDLQLLAREYKFVPAVTGMVAQSHIVPGGATQSAVMSTVVAERIV